VGQPHLDGLWIEVEGVAQKPHGWVSFLEVAFVVSIHNTNVE